MRTIHSKHFSKFDCRTCCRVRLMSVLATTHSNIHWFMPSTKTKCYSYIRWSSDKQTSGTSFARQSENAKKEKRGR